MSYSIDDITLDSVDLKALVVTSGVKVASQEKGTKIENRPLKRPVGYLRDTFIPIGGVNRNKCTLKLR